MESPLNRKRARLGILLTLAILDAGLILSGALEGMAIILSVLLGSYAMIWGAKVALRHSRLIWRLRNRLIVTYVFVGAVPIVLILALAVCGTWIVVGQIATYLVSSELTRRASALENPARFLSEAPAAERPEIMKQMVPLMRDRFPGFEVAVSGDKPYRYPADTTLKPPEGDWRKYTGLVKREGRYYLMSLADSGATRAVVLAPLSSAVMSHIIPGLGNVGLGERRAGLIPEAANSFDFEVIWFNRVDAANWNVPNSLQPATLSVSTRPSAVLAVVFADRLEAATFGTVTFIAMSILLALVELGSVVISTTMTRTITSAVENLYEGTLHIGRGDFTHRIEVKGHDQLAVLGKSFNEMSAQLESLVTVTKEKERLQSELTIASEVQNQLFPRETPPMKTIELIGACIPARSVSGDYYDYLCLPNGNLAIAIGDVAGKGISAALLMASIQSIMRTQLAQGIPMAAAAGNGHAHAQFSTASMVSQLNRQLYANTSPEKYATFFFGLYDENSRVLTYTNAGHLPPIVICGGEPCPLEVTGTVVGLFPTARYEERSVKLCPDDILIGYTDGISEPENAYGEEYGIERLSESVLRNRACEPSEIVAKVMEAVKQWSHSPELPDDMTVLIAKGIL
jgi:sigma-B regulation protein RsbU (phosphoserine phosphatase)